MKLVLAAMLVLSATFAFAQDGIRRGTFGGAHVGGQEYWPFDDDIPGSPYPDRVIWSFGGASDAAQRCMIEANTLLISWLQDENHPVTKAIQEYNEAGGSASFFMWVNDYTKAPNQARNARRNQVWYWSSDGDQVRGLLKFESTLMPDGTCKTPNERQAASFIERHAGVIRGIQANERMDESRRRNEGGTIDQNSVDSALQLWEQGTER